LLEVNYNNGIVALKEAKYADAVYSIRWIHSFIRAFSQIF